MEAEQQDAAGSLEVLRIWPDQANERAGLPDCSKRLRAQRIRQAQSFEAKRLILRGSCQRRLDGLGGSLGTEKHDWGVCLRHDFIPLGALYAS
jgi:hypothetical protein